MLSKMRLKYIAWPVADSALSQEILDLVQQANHYRQVRSSSNPHF